jgi:type VI secretion system secreted protein Hcp
MAEGDLFLKIVSKAQGELQGESKKTGKEGWTQIGTFQLGAVQPGSFGMHSGGSTGKVDFSDVTFTTEASKITPLIFKAMGNHDQLTEVWLVARKGTGSMQEDYLWLKLTDAIFTTYNLHVGENGPPQVSGSINFRQISINYKPQNEDQSLGAEVMYEFDQSLGQSANG